MKKALFKITTFLTVLFISLISVDTINANSTDKQYVNTKAAPLMILENSPITCKICGKNTWWAYGSWNGDEADIEEITCTTCGYNQKYPF